MTKPSYPPWLPDWRYESRYPDPETTTPEKWAWEFLRRNPDYQKDFSFLKLIPRHETFRYSQGSQSNLGYSPELEFVPTDEPGKEMNQWLNKYSESERWLNPYRFMAEKYGLFKIVDPSHDSPFGSDTPRPVKSDSIDPFYLPNIKLFTPPVRLLGTPSNLIDYEEGLLSGRKTKFEIEVSLNEVVASLDVLSEIKPQIDYLESKMEEIQEGIEHSVTPFRYQKDLYRRYLRILDASSSGLNIPQIAEGLFPKEYSEDDGVQVKKRVEKNLSAVKEICRYDYRFIASHTPKR